MTRSRYLRPALLLGALAIALPAFAQRLDQDFPPPATGTPARAPAPVDPAQPQALDRIVAVVNDGVILQSQLDETMVTVAKQITGQGGRLPPTTVLQKQVLQRLILNELLAQRARDNGVRISDDQVNAAVTNIAEQNKLTVPQMQAAMAQQGVDYASFRQQLREQLLAQSVQKNIMQQSGQASDSEIDNLVASPVFRQGEVRLARIVVALPEGANAMQIAAAQARADRIETQLDAGKDFAAIAVSESSAPEALDGGDLGWLRVAELPPPVQQVIATLAAGGHTRPLRDATGFTIIKLVGKRAPDTQQIVTEFHARHLMIKPTAVLDSAGAKAKITKLYDEIVHQHADFATLAQRDSDDPTTANTGGDMGWFMQDEWGVQVGHLLASMQPGQVTEPFSSQDGSWHIVQLLGSRQADKTRDIEREQARQAIAMRKGRQAYEQFLRDTESAAFINILIPDLADANPAGHAGSP